MDNLDTPGTDYEAGDSAFMTQAAVLFWTPNTGTTPPSTCPAGMAPNLYGDAVNMVNYDLDGMFDQATLAGMNALTDAESQYPGNATISQAYAWAQQGGYKADSALPDAPVPPALPQLPDS
jgi:hypothetical protein